MVSIVGCPRSGTTVFGQILSCYPDFLYLFEPRYIWCSGNPELNVWGAGANKGRLYWDAGDVNPQERRRLARWFHFALTLSGKRRLVEKLPLHIFRIRWMSAMFPDAKFIQVIRNGPDVALSLQKLVKQRFSAERGYAEGYWESNWNYLMFEDYAGRVPELSGPLAVVRSRDDNYARSLFAWLCSVWEGCRAGEEIGSERYLEVCYEDLVREPEMVLGQAFDFLEEPVDEGTVAQARRVLHADSVCKPDPNPEVTRAIAGTMLAKLGYEV
jgi:hypothetical protein